MSRVTISTKKPPLFSCATLRYATTVPQTKRIELHLAELDLVHAPEIKRLGALLKIAKQKLFTSGRQREQ